MLPQCADYGCINFDSSKGWSSKPVPQPRGNHPSAHLGYCRHISGVVLHTYFYVAGTMHGVLIKGDVLISGGFLVYGILYSSPPHRESSLSSLRGLIRGAENSTDAGTPLGPGASLTSPSSSLGTPANAGIQVNIVMYGT